MRYELLTNRTRAIADWHIPLVDLAAAGTVTTWRERKRENCETKIVTCSCEIL